jgi:phage shock protein PspC (stress-responsive transcriptional regulator)
MEKFKQLLFSENGIKIVNMLFFLAFLAHNLVFLVVAYLVWILFLAFCIKKAASRCCAGTAGAITQRASAFLPHRPFDFVGRSMLCHGGTLSAVLHLSLAAS